MMRKRNKQLTPTYRLIQLGLLLVISFAAGRMLVFAQTWNFPASQPPQRNTSQPPGAGPGYLMKSPTTLQTVQKQIEAANASSVAAALGGINGTIAVSAKNSFTNPGFPSGKIGVFGYAAGTEYGIFGYSAGTGAAYGIMGKTGASGLAGQFEGGVRVIDNGMALGTLLVEDTITAGQGLNCSDGLGCALLAGMTGLTGTHSAGGKGIYGNSTTRAGISATIDHAANEGGKPVEARATYGYGIAGFGTDGVYSKAIGSAAAAGATYTGIAGYAETPDSPDGKRSRSGVYGLSDGGLGNATSYTTNPPNYDLAAGIRACVKDTAGAIVNKNGIKGTGGKFAGYFDGASGSCTITDATVVDGSGANYYNDQAVGADGKPAVAYQLQGAPERSLRILRCARPDCVNTPPSQTNTITDYETGVAGGSGWGPSIAIPADNKPVASFVSGSSVKVLKCNDPSCITATITPLSTTGTPSKSVTSIAIGSNGHPIVTYATTGGGAGIKLIRCTNATCTSADPERTLDSTNSAEHPSIMVPPDNNPVISFSASNDLWVSKCSDSACSTVPTPILIVPEGSTGARYSDITYIPGTSVPIIAFHMNARTNIYKCADSSCSAGQHIDIAESTTFSSRMSIIVPSHGHPRVAYSKVVGGGDDQVQYLVCNNPACSSRSIIQPDIDPGEENFDMIAALHPSGAVTIAYFNNTNFDLKMLYCNNDFCAPQACTPPATDGGQVLIAGTGSVDAAKGAVLRIGNVYLTKCNLIGLLRKAGYTQYPACS